MTILLPNKFLCRLLLLILFSDLRACVHFVIYARSIRWCTVLCIVLHILYQCIVSHCICQAISSALSFIAWMKRSFWGITECKIKWESTRSGNPSERSRDIRQTLKAAVCQRLNVHTQHRVPGEIKRREVELDPQVGPEEIMSREVELGCESWTSFASACSSTAVQRTLSLWLCPNTAVKTAIAQCTSRRAMARGHRLNTSIVLAAVHGLSGLFLHTV